MKRLTTILFFIISYCCCFSQKPATKEKPAKLIFSDDFNTLDTHVWIAETAPLPDSKIYIKNGALILDTKGGNTVWLNKKLSGNIRIEYKRKVLVDSSKNDRLSDLNTFWMAIDPRNDNLFTRNGIFESYDSLQLYFVGMGGNSNTTTRFRKYQGNGEKKLIQEYTDSKHLLEANKEYNIIITVKDGTTSFSVNNEIFFSYEDPAPLQKGYFGFRSTKSRQAIDEIRIYQLE